MSGMWICKVRLRNLQKFFYGILALTIVFLMSFANAAPLATPKPTDSPDPIGAELKRQLGELNLSGWEGIAEKNGMKGQSVAELVSALATGKNALSVDGFLSAIANALKGQLVSQLFLVVQLIAIALLSSLLSNLRTGFGGRISEMGGFACYAIAIGVVVSAFSSMAQVGREAVGQLTGFMQMVFPILLTLLTALGSTSAAAVFRPATAMLVNSVGTVFMNICMPLILAAGAMAIISHLGERASLSKLCKLLKDCCKWLTGILTTVYLGVVSLQGLTAGSFDGVSVRTAKYALNNFVPMAGRMVADTVDTVLGCSLLIKNALGVTSIVITALILLTPLATILSGMLAFRLAAALSQPVAMDKLPSMMGGVADVLGMLFGALLAVGAMFMVTVGLLISAGNAAVMLR